MALEVVDGYREITAVTRKHALFDAFGNDAFGVGVPSNSDIIRSVRNTSQSDRMRAATRALRQGILRKPEEVIYDRIEVIKRRKERWDDNWSHPNRCRFAQVGQGVGVEIEFCVDIENRDELQEINGNKPNGVPGIRLIYDATPQFSDDRERCRESEARCFFQYGKWARLYAICQRLRDVGAEVNQTCGLHVHLDCRDVSSTSAMATRAVRLRKAVPWLWNMLPVSRRRSRYCGDQNGGRFQAINTESYSRHNTVEVRMHSGTLNADKIRSWIELVRFIALRSGQGKRPTHLTSLQQFLSCNEAPEQLKQWAVTRTNTFNPVDGTGEEASEVDSE